MPSASLTALVRWFSALHELRQEHKAHKEIWLWGMEEYISNGGRYCVHGTHAYGELSRL